ncbi:cyclin-like protein [Gonapodya prolifera JEL478]|uniref:Cyclin-like protein n=1 Tax=Gonapodya prolifera (strain JEL478) TaxID=1344416 RepID=A0A139AND3_GONPJ|nr:cyclin-like protein [Gonapodya prolifera JEL478]|eukprot:KXS18144.1 cyclin-like protein [Gonapodya prolifera JEL478]
MPPSRTLTTYRDLDDASLPEPYPPPSRAGLPDVYRPGPHSRARSPIPGPPFRQHNRLDWDQDPSARPTHQKDRYTVRPPPSLLDSLARNSRPIGINQWLFSEEHLDSTPSIRKGMPKEEEWSYRRKAVAFIDKVVRALRLSSPVSLTASLLIHRFYMLNNFQDCPYHDVAGAALFLAGKIEGDFRRMTHVIQQCARKALRKEDVDVKEGDKLYDRWKRTIVFFEHEILVDLRFDLIIRHPHEHMVDLAARYAPAATGKLVNDLLTHAWLAVHDSYLTPLPLLHTPMHLACGALYLAAEVLGVSLRNDYTNGTKRRWYEVVGMKGGLVRALAKAMHESVVTGGLSYGKPIDVAMLSADPGDSGEKSAPQTPPVGSPLQAGIDTEPQSTSPMDVDTNVTRPRRAADEEVEEGEVDEDES